jgi:hypothetical protein
VRLGRKWGFLNSKGEMVVKPQFESADNFYEGLASCAIYHSENGQQQLRYGAINMAVNGQSPRFLIHYLHSLVEKLLQEQQNKTSALLIDQEKL